MSTEALAAARDYSEALSELTGNDKKQINLLTILAEDYVDHSTEIVRVIQEAITTTPKNGRLKLALLYVIDSIIKNIPIRGNYRDHFAQVIVPIFLTVFNEGDEKIRASLYKVRNTWKGIFPQSKLRKLDLEVKSIDKNWPLVEEAPAAPPIVTPQPAVRPPIVTPAAVVTTSVPVINGANQVIHVNPKFLNNGAPAPPQPTAPLKSALKKPANTVSDPRIAKGTVTVVPSNGKRVVSLEESTSGAQAPQPSGSAAPEARPELPKASEPPTPRTQVEPERRPSADRDPKSVEQQQRPLDVQIKTEMPDELEESGHKKHKKEKKKKADKEERRREKEVEKERRREEKKKKKMMEKSDSITDTSSIRSDSVDDAELVGAQPVSPPPIERPIENLSLGRRSRENSESSGKSPSDDPEAKRPRRDHDGVHHAHSRQQHHQYQPRGRGRFDKPVRHQGPPSHGPGTGNRIPLLSHQQHPVVPQAPTAALGSHAFAAPPPQGLPTSIPASMAQPRIPPPGMVVPNPISGLPPGLIMSSGQPPIMSAPPPMVGMPGMPMMPPQMQMPSHMPPHMPPMIPPVISNETTRLPNVPANNRIFVDGKAYEVLHVKDERGLETAVIERNGLPHKISFTGTTRDVLIDGQAYTMAFGEFKTVCIDGDYHVLRFGAPSRELYIGDYPFKGAFGGAPIIANINGRRHEIRLMGPPPEVKIEQDPSYDLLRFMNEIRRQQQADFKPVVKEEKKDQSLEVQDLLAKLTKSGILKTLTAKTEQPLAKKLGPSSSQARGASPPVPSNHRLDIIERRPTPGAAMKDFNMRTFFYRYDSVIKDLHRERILCPTCNIEFRERGESYQLHIDNHLKDMVMTNNKGYSNKSRRWYMEEDSWVNHSELEEVNNLTDGRKGGPTGAAAAAETTGNDDVIADETEAKECCVCNEAFEQYWDDDDDNWKLRDCVIQNGKAYHRNCLADATLDQSQEEEEDQTMDSQDSFKPPADDSSSHSISLPSIGLNIDTDFLKNVIEKANRVQ